MLTANRSSVEAGKARGGLAPPEIGEASAPRVDSTVRKLLERSIGAVRNQRLARRSGPDQPAGARMAQGALSTEELHLILAYPAAGGLAECRTPRTWEVRHRAGGGNRTLPAHEVAPEWPWSLGTQGWPEATGSCVSRAHQGGSSVRVLGGVGEVIARPSGPLHEGRAQFQCG